MESHRKLIVPVVALLLCAVSIVGVGFAYQGTYKDTASSDLAIDSYALEVDKGENSFGYGSSYIAIKFDSSKNNVAQTTEGKARMYTFNASENSGVLTNISNNGKTAEYSVTVKIKVTATEMPNSGAITGSLTISDLSTSEPTTQTGFATCSSAATTTPISFTIAENSADRSTIVDVTLKFTLDATKVTDSNIDYLVLPAFTFTATAATAQA